MESELATPLTRTSIASLYNLCVRDFIRLSDALESSEDNFSDELSSDSVQDEPGRFKIWAALTRPGAFHSTTG